MAFLIFTDVTKRRNKISDLEVDVTLQENYSFPTTITSHPVEEGFKPSDHVIDDPVSYTMTGLVSNTPVEIFGGTSDRVQATYEKLLDLRLKKIPFTVVTQLDEFENMLFTSIEITRTSNSGQTLEFKAQLKQIVITEIETVSVAKSKLSEPLKDTATPPTEKGKVVGDEITDTSNQTHLLRLVNFVTG